MDILPKRIVERRKYKRITNFMTLKVHTKLVQMTEERGELDLKATLTER